MRNIVKYNFLNFKYFFKIVEDLEELDHALQKKIRVSFASSTSTRTAEANVWGFFMIFEPASKMS